MRKTVEVCKFGAECSYSENIFSVSSLVNDLCEFESNHGVRLPNTDCVKFSKKFENVIKILQLFIVFFDFFTSMVSDPSFGPDG